ncbi:MAG: hypothetical protein M3474_02795, partial [Actinomycetota bacterium]|nr:hypothetical protein [Actinomycetota bacterium]
MHWSRDVKGKRQGRAVIATAAGLGLSMSVLAGPGATAVPTVAVPTAAGPAVDEPRPVLALATAADTVTAYKFGRWVDVELGAYLVAGDERFEVITQRAPSYRTEPVSSVNGQEVPVGLSGFGGLDDFVRLQVRDGTGVEVFDGTRTMCMNGWSAVRTRPDAPNTSDFPQGCETSPFMLGEVQGVEAGWGVPVSTGRSLNRLPLGRYTLTVAVTKQWRDVLGIGKSAAKRTVVVRIVDGEDNCGQCRAHRRDP